MGNNIITTSEDMIIETAEVASKRGLPRGVKIAIGAGITATAVYLGYRFVVKPVVKKIKAAQQASEEETDSKKTVIVAAEDKKETA